MKRHRWNNLESDTDVRRRVCQREDCGLQARRYGHGAGSYWDYTTPDGRFLGVRSHVPPCGGPWPEPRQLPDPVHRGDVFSRIEASAMAEYDVFDRLGHPMRQLQRGYFDQERARVAMLNLETELLREGRGSLKGRLTFDPGWDSEETNQAIAADFERAEPEPKPDDIVRVIEIDTMTGAERPLDNYKNKPWTETFTRAQAEESVAWRRKNITARYGYRIELAK